MMFYRVGRKIKVLAQVIAWAGIAASIVGGTLFGAFAGEMWNSVWVGISMGMMIVILGSLASWIGSFLLYGYGQLIDNSDKVAESVSAHTPQIPVCEEKLQETVS